MNTNSLIVLLKTDDNNLIKQYEMINIDDVTKESMKEHNPNWPQISNHYYQLLIIGGTGFGKTNYLIII